MKEKEILYENGKYWVRNDSFGKSKSVGFSVYKTGITCSTRVCSIGYAGDEGFQRAKKECDKRAGESP